MRVGGRAKAIQENIHGPFPGPSIQDVNEHFGSKAACWIAKITVPA
jgi:hypothetical protein